MADAFDPYHRWLGISPKDQPANHYRLLGLDLFESDPDVIDSAADRQMAHVRTFQSGPHSAHSQKVLNVLSAAKICLLHAQRKAEYDEALRIKLAAAASPAPAQPTSVQPRPALPSAPEPTPAQSMPAAEIIPQYAQAASLPPPVPTYFTPPVMPAPQLQPRRRTQFQPFRLKLNRQRLLLVRLARTAGPSLHWLPDSVSCSWFCLASRAC